MSDNETSAQESKGEGLYVIRGKIQQKTNKVAKTADVNEVSCNCFRMGCSEMSEQEKNKIKYN